MSAETKKADKEKKKNEREKKKDQPAAAAKAEKDGKKEGKKVEDKADGKDQSKGEQPKDKNEKKTPEGQKVPEMQLAAIFTKGGTKTHAVRVPGEKAGREESSESECSKWSTNPHLFRSKPTAPGLWTSRKAWNKLIKSSHENTNQEEG